MNYVPWYVGYLSASRIKDYYRSYRESTFPDEATFSEVQTWVEQSMTWTLQSVMTGESSSPYWNVVGLTMTQLLSLVEGYNAAGTDFPLTLLDLFMLNSIGDMDDLIPAMQYLSAKRKATPEHPVADFCDSLKCVLDAQSRSHCSAIVKPVNGELFAAHEMWASYLQMLMVWKQYDFGLANRELSSRRIAFSSWPAMLSSEDDFYITQAKLVVMETTNNVYNLTLYDRLKPSSLLSWIRAITANYLASTPDHWHRLMKAYNSGTYNNQWMVIDMKNGPFLASASTTALKPNTLLIGSQLPGYYHHADVTEFINTHGYWASYNIPYFPEAFKLAGYDVMVKKYGLRYTWDDAPRAKIFRQRQSSAVNMTSFQTLMRYNDWQHDPLSLNCPMHQLASRGDLSPPNNPECYRNAFGAVNAKITSSSRASNFEANIIAGPTHDTQPVFSWTPEIEAQFPTAHYGQPKTFDFYWQTVRSPSP